MSMTPSEACCQGKRYCLSRYLVSFNTNLAVVLVLLGALVTCATGLGDSLCLSSLSWTGCVRHAGGKTAEVMLCMQGCCLTVFFPVTTSLAAGKLSLLCIWYHFCQAGITSQQPAPSMLASSTFLILANIACTICTTWHCNDSSTCLPCAPISQLAKGFVNHSHGKPTWQLLGSFYRRIRMWQSLLIWNTICTCVCSC